MISSWNTNLNECFKWNSENGFVKNEKRKNELVLVENIVYQKNNIKGLENHDSYKSHYEVLKRVSRGGVSIVTSPQTNNRNGFCSMKF